MLAYILKVLQEIGDSFPLAVSQDWLVESISRSACHGAEDVSNLLPNHVVMVAYTFAASSRATIPHGRDPVPQGQRDPSLAVLWWDYAENQASLIKWETIAIKSSRYCRYVTIEWVV
jgi:hypothetical protein